jgi:hypothetical protein
MENELKLKLILINFYQISKNLILELKKSTFLDK